MSLPEALRARVEAGERLYKEVYGSESSTPADPAAQAPVVPLDPIPEPKPEPAPEPKPEPAPAPPPPPPEPKQPVRDYAMEQKLADLERDLKMERKRAEEASKKYEELAREQETTISAEDLAQFGPEMVDFVKRAAKNTVSAELQDVKRENERLKYELASFTGDVQAVKRQSDAASLAEMKAVLAQNVSDWQQVDTDPQFIKWLDRVDDVTGDRYKDVLKRHVDARDGLRVAAVFNKYKSTVKAMAAEAAKPSLDSFAGPSSSGKPGPDASSSSGAVWTRSRIAQFYEDNRKGRIPKAQFASLEANLKKALQEGKVFDG